MHDDDSIPRDVGRLPTWGSCQGRPEAPLPCHGVEAVGRTATYGWWRCRTQFLLLCVCRPNGACRPGSSWLTGSSLPGATDLLGQDVDRPRCHVQYNHKRGPQVSQHYGQWATSLSGVGLIIGIYLMQCHDDQQMGKSLLCGAQMHGWIFRGMSRVSRYLTGSELGVHPTCFAHHASAIHLSGGVWCVVYGIVWCAMFGGCGGEALLALI
ncbi:hypothetical protein QBC36DRAFT_15660 [Triangularia setosa]|uniref:Uncharacterized protein n=1 Tax=Triangularia setosa TaxID=2587417 RepID=A0AAN6WFL6_9PEZI|nr:hypothetical protein QBC36DRAFT_15660 [Podospora setosa]